MDCNGFTLFTNVDRQTLKFKEEIVTGFATFKLSTNFKQGK